MRPVMSSSSSEINPGFALILQAHKQAASVPAPHLQVQKCAVNLLRVERPVQSGHNVIPAKIVENFCNNKETSPSPKTNQGKKRKLPATYDATRETSLQNQPWKGMTDCLAFNSKSKTPTPN
ncbi:hypothetical protein Tco_1199730 [Tanacetum coccineum]